MKYVAILVFGIAIGIAVSWALGRVPDVVQSSEIRILEINPYKCYKCGYNSSALGGPITGPRLCPSCGGKEIPKQGMWIVWDEEMREKWIVENPLPLEVEHENPD